MEKRQAGQEGQQSKKIVFSWQTSGEKDWVKVDRKFPSFFPASSIPEIWTPFR